MKTRLLLLFLLSSTFCFGQISTYWIGGTPGNETKWELASNWSNNHIPDAFTDVIIDGFLARNNTQPIITSSVEIASLIIYSGSMLTIKNNGELLIDGEYHYTNGIVNHGGELVNNGEVRLDNINYFEPVGFLNMIKGIGKVWLDGNILEVMEYANNLK